MSIQRQIQHENVRSKNWKSVKTSLIGIGCHPMQLDGLRLHLPALWRAKLGRILQRPWIMSLWIEGQLCVIPKVLWEEYLCYIETELSSSDAARPVCAWIARLAVETKMDHANRWVIPTFLASKTVLGGENNNVILVPHEAWIEIWGAKRWDQQTEIALKPYTHGVPRQPDSSQGYPFATNDSRTATS